MTSSRHLFRSLLPSFLAVCTACVTAATSDDPSALLRLLRDDVLAQPVAGKHVYVARAPLTGGTVVRTWRTTYAVPPEFARAWFFFVDDAPGANWEHPCRYVFVDIETSRHAIVPASTPPNDLAEMRRLYPER